MLRLLWTNQHLVVLNLTPFLTLINIEFLIDYIQGIHDHLNPVTNAILKMCLTQIPCRFLSILLKRLNQNQPTLKKYMSNLVSWKNPAKHSNLVPV